MRLLVVLLLASLAACSSNDKKEQKDVWILNERARYRLNLRIR